MTRLPFVFVLVCTLGAASLPVFGQPQASDTLEATLALMDKAAVTFRGLTADIRRQTHTDVVNADDVEEGTVAVKRLKPKDTRILITITKPEPKSYYVGEGKFRMFNAKSLEAQEANLGKSKDLVNEFMLLGFGSNAAQLKAAYTIKAGGPETINGEKTTRIEMVPKSEEILKYVKRCDMWISGKGLALQQKFFQPGRDYVLATYSHMQQPQNLPDSAVRLEIPKGVKITKLK